MAASAVSKASGSSYGSPPALTCPSTIAEDLLVFVTTAYAGVNPAPIGASLAGWIPLWNDFSSGGTNPVASQGWYKIATGTEGSSSLNPGTGPGGGGQYSLGVYRGGTIESVSLFSSVTTNTAMVGTVSGPTAASGKINIIVASLMGTKSSGISAGPSIFSPTPDATLSSYYTGYISDGMWLYNTSPGSNTNITDAVGSNGSSTSRLFYDIAVTVSSAGLCMII